MPVAVNGPMGLTPKTTRKFMPLRMAASLMWIRTTKWLILKRHYRYGIRLDFASADGQTITMSYSIEPMVDPGNENFYEDFILVSKGDTVKKGDVIAYMHISTDATIGTDHRIHFNLLKSQSSGIILCRHRPYLAPIL